jgi:hypothetical protein
MGHRRHVDDGLRPKLSEYLFRRSLPNIGGEDGDSRRGVRPGAAIDACNFMTFREKAKGDDTAELS